TRSIRTAYKWSPHTQPAAYAPCVSRSLLDYSRGLTPRSALTPSAQIIGRCRCRVQAQQCRGIRASDPCALELGDGQLGGRVEHRRDAADLVGVIAASQDMVGAREADRELERTLIEIDGIVIKIPQVRARWPLNVRPTFAERVEAAVQPLGEVRNGATE